VADAWFPRGLDTEYGGFLCDFDRRWRSIGPHDKQLEFQARQTLLAAELLRRYPTAGHLRAAVDHGLGFLRDVLWDREHGGWFHRLARDGRPLAEGTKHVHGLAYGIRACVAVYEATGEAGALQLARTAFAWLDRSGHDARHGGYFGMLRRDGAAVHSEAESPLPGPTDALGNHLGLKDANVHTDVLQALAALHGVDGDPSVRARLIEVAEVIVDRLTMPSGALAFYTQADWTPVPYPVRLGYSFQAASRLLASRAVIGAHRDSVGVARRLMGFAIEFGLDHQQGGFYTALPAVHPFSVEGSDLVVRGKVWWVQLEALRALLALAAAVEGPYLRHFARQWRYVRHNLLDDEYGGFYPAGLDTLPRSWRALGPRFAPVALTRKGSPWQDGSHQGCALLYCIDALPGVLRAGGETRAAP
jgi:mannobiose 2-epimerase